MPDDEEVVLAFRRFGISGDFVILVRILTLPGGLSISYGYNFDGTRHKLSCPL